MNFERKNLISVILLFCAINLFFSFIILYLFIIRADNEEVRYKNLISKIEDINKKGKRRGRGKVDIAGDVSKTKEDISDIKDMIGNIHDHFFPVEKKRIDYCANDVESESCKLQKTIESQISDK